MRIQMSDVCSMQIGRTASDLRSLPFPSPDLPEKTWRKLTRSKSCDRRILFESNERSIRASDVQITEEDVAAKEHQPTRTAKQEPFQPVNVHL